MSRRVALAGLFRESNTFVDTPTTLADFDLRRGEQITARLEGTQTVLGGFFAAAFERVPILYGYAVPAGMVTRDAYDSLVDELCAGLAAAGRLDGVLIELHGAMVVDGLGAADGRAASGSARRSARRRLRSCSTRTPTWQKGWWRRPTWCSPTRRSRTRTWPARGRGPPSCSGS